MFPFRLKTGRNTVPTNGGGISIDVKNLGRTLSSLTSVANPSEVDGDGDGFVTGRDGRDNIPFKGPVKKMAALWSEKQQKALDADEKRIIAVAKKLKGRKPKYTISEIDEIFSKAKTREEITKARKAARDLAKSLFEMDGIGENGEYKVRLYKGETGVAIHGRKRESPAVHQENPYPPIGVAGEIVD